jgi:hypothetical protein
MIQSSPLQFTLLRRRLPADLEDKACVDDTSFSSLLIGLKTIYCGVFSSFTA